MKDIIIYMTIENSPKVSLLLTMLGYEPDITNCIVNGNHKFFYSQYGLYIGERVFNINKCQLFDLLELSKHVDLTTEKKIKFDEGIKIIGSNIGELLTYNGNYKLKNNNLDISFPKSLEKICDFAFIDCSRLTEVYFPDDCNLSEIGESAFRWCDITKFDFKKLSNLRTINKNAFVLTDIEEIIFSKNSKLSLIRESAFNKCLKLRTVDFRGCGELAILKDSFSACTNLRTMYMPKDMSIFDFNMFDTIEPMNVDIYFDPDCFNIIFINMDTIHSNHYLTLHVGEKLFKKIKNISNNNIIVNKYYGDYDIE